MLCECCQSEILNKRSDAKYCSNLCGNTVRVKRFIMTEEAKQRKLSLQTERRKLPINQYKAHKGTAKQRNIPFLLTFEEWWGLWKDHWSPHKYGKLCMCRNGDAGAYTLGNVRIDSWANNIREAKGLPLK